MIRETLRPDCQTFQPACAARKDLPWQWYIGDLESCKPSIQGGVSLERANEARRLA
jgi:hypothetical protein